MSIHRYLMEVPRKIVKRGPAFIAAYFKDVMLFDLINRTDTSGRKTHNNESDENIYYVPSFTSVIEETINYLHTSLGKAFYVCQFVDIGSGKGKVVLVYTKLHGARAEFPPIGIEYDPKLAAIANRNIAKMRFGAEGIRVLADDARNVLAHVVGGRLILFLYNPFFGSIFYDLVARLKDTPHVMIYVDPVERAYLEASGYRIEAERVGRYNSDTWIIASKWH